MNGITIDGKELKTGETFTTYRRLPSGFLSCNVRTVREVFASFVVFEEMPKKAFKISEIDKNGALLHHYTTRGKQTMAMTMHR